jgi:hypothetical protein
MGLTRLNDSPASRSNCPAATPSTLVDDTYCSYVSGADHWSNTSQTLVKLWSNTTNGQGSTCTTGKQATAII